MVHFVNQFKSETVFASKKKTLNVFHESISDPEPETFWRLIFILDDITSAPRNLDTKRQGTLDHRVSSKTVPA